MPTRESSCFYESWSISFDCLCWLELRHQVGFPKSPAHLDYAYLPAIYWATATTHYADHLASQCTMTCIAALQAGMAWVTQDGCSHPYLIGGEQIRAHRLQYPSLAALHEVCNAKAQFRIVEALCALQSTSAKRTHANQSFGYIEAQTS